MLRLTVRFVSDTEPVTAGDLGDDGEETLAKINSGEYIVVGMVVYDDELVQADVARGTVFETAVHGYSVDSLWQIVVPSAAINDCDRDITSGNWTKVGDEYLRSLAGNWFAPVDSGDVNRG